MTMRPEQPDGGSVGDVRFYSQCELPTDFGLFHLHVYRDGADAEHLLLTFGEPSGADAPFVRVHSECFTGEVLASLKCDCRHQLETAMQRIVDEGSGAIVYLRQEGRGIGLGNKILAYAEQQKGADTIEANERLGFPIDSRDFQIAARLLELHGLCEIRLNTNNPQKVRSLQDHGIRIREVIESQSPSNPHNEGYLRTKQERLGHHGLRLVLRRNQS